MKLERRSFLSSLPLCFLGMFNWIEGVTIFASVKTWWKALVQPGKNGEAERLRAWNSEYRKMGIDGTVVQFAPDSVSALLALSNEALSDLWAVNVGELAGPPPCMIETIATVLSARHGLKSRLTFELFMELIDLEDELGVQKIADESEIECNEFGIVTREICLMRHLSLAAVADPKPCKYPQVCVNQNLDWIGHCLYGSPSIAEDSALSG